MTITRSTLYGFIALSLLALFYLMVTTSRQVFASAPAGAPATVASTSLITVGTVVAALPIVATSSCAARIVSTGPQAVMLTFSDVLGQIPRGNFGYYQAASTTFAYDSGLYGCGSLRAFGAGGSNSTITVSDVQ